MKNYHVYILKCSDGKLYTGVTSEIEKRLWEHKNGFYKKCFTYKRRPVSLVHVEEYNGVIQAISREKQIKGWKRIKKLALIDKQIDLLCDLANN